MSDLDQDGKIFVGKSAKPEVLTLALANRHGLVTGATGTGKTVTCRCWRKACRAPACRSSPPTSRATCPASPKPGEAKEAFVSARQEPRASTTSPTSSRSCSGICSASRAIRSAPPSPRWGRCCCRGCIDLNDVQEGVLNICFRVADEQGLLLLDLKDLRADARLSSSEHAAELDRRNTATSSKPTDRHHPAPAAGAGEPGRRANSSASRRWR